MPPTTFQRNHAVARNFDPRLVNRFRERRSAQIVVALLTLLALGVIIANFLLGWHNNWVLLGCGIVLICLIVYSVNHWRCPACDNFLGVSLFIDRCPHCGESFTDED